MRKTSQALVVFIFETSYDISELRTDIHTADVVIWESKLETT